MKTSAQTRLQELRKNRKAVKNRIQSINRQLVSLSGDPENGNSEIGRRHAGKRFYLETIETKKPVKSPGLERVLITLSNPPTRNPLSSEILVEFENNALSPDDGSEKLKFQFIATDYEDAFSKLSRCVCDYMDQDGHDPLQ